MSFVSVNRAVDGRNARRAAFLALLFSTYMFEYMVTLTFIDQRNIAISGSSWQLALHYIDALLSAAGFASFALLRRIFNEEKTRVRLLVIPSLVGNQIEKISHDGDAEDDAVDQRCNRYES